MLNTLKETIIKDLLNFTRDEYEKNKSEINDRIEEISLEIKSAKNYNGKNRLKVFLSDYKENKKESIENFLNVIILSTMLIILFSLVFIVSSFEDSLFFITGMFSFFIFFIIIMIYFDLPKKTKKSLRLDKLKKQRKELIENNNKYVEMLVAVFSEKQIPIHLLDYPISLPVLNEVKKEFSDDMIKELLMKGSNKEIKYTHLIQMIKEKQVFWENEKAFRRIMGGIIH